MFIEYLLYARYIYSIVKFSHILQGRYFVIHILQMINPSVELAK